jgi:uncharacterized repeat protein (TIGR01451 family)
MPVPTPAAPHPGPLRAILAFCAVLQLPGPVLAAEASKEAPTVATTGSGPLETEIVVEALLSEQRANGSTDKRFVEAQRLEAGEEVYYTIRVRNPGKEPVTDIVVTKRMPFGVDYVSGSAAGPACEVEFSADNGSTYSSGGKSGEFTHVRWVFQRPLAPGATALLRFRATFR